MQAKAKRTLVKSAPELWELADDPERMQAWMADLLEAPAPVGVQVTDRRVGHVLAWRADAASAAAEIELELSEKGFGTCVCITAKRADEPCSGAALERVLDELGSPERRPFTHA